ncbi:MAG TPA: hypothetical protein VNJ04_07635 [Gemmatimonadaceae bacterium]|nr:hypothetical protein [Gemmatimonadaceae bacterium]
MSVIGGIPENQPDVTAPPPQRGQVFAAEPISRCDQDRVVDVESNVEAFALES